MPYIKEETLQAFDYVKAGSVSEVISLMAQHNGKARVLAGGTDLLVALREGRTSADLVIDVKKLPELGAVSYSTKTGLSLGASVPCYRLYEDKTVSAAYPGLMDSATIIGGIGVQGRASIGGNLCNASPAADSIPTLIALGAICNIAGPNGTRTLPVEQFCVAPGKNCLGLGEFLVSLSIPAPVAGSGAAYMRFIPRNEMDIAVVGVGAAVVLDETRSKFVSALCPGSWRRTGRSAGKCRQHCQSRQDCPGCRKTHQRHARHCPISQTPRRRDDTTNVGKGYRTSEEQIRELKKWLRRQL